MDIPMAFRDRIVWQGRVIENQEQELNWGVRLPVFKTQWHNLLAI